MPRRFVLRGTATLCMFAGSAALSIRKDGAVRTEPVLFDRSHVVQRESVAATASSRAKPNGGVRWHPSILYAV